MVIIIMGVSGCGKTTIGIELTKNTGLPFYDGDDFHPKTNIQKMSKGIPLNDADRRPWLQMLAENALKWEAEGGAIIACSALKESYRLILQSKTKVHWIYLTASYEHIYERMKNRTHFMKSAMLQSQFDTLEVPDYGIHIDATLSPGKIVSKIISILDDA